MFCNQTLRLTKSSEGDINLSFGFLLACRVSDYRSYNMLVNVGKFYTFKRRCASSKQCMLQHVQEIAKVFFFFILVSQKYFQEVY